MLAVADAVVICVQSATESFSHRLVTLLVQTTKQMKPLVEPKHLQEHLPFVWGIPTVPPQTAFSRTVAVYRLLLLLLHQHDCGCRFCSGGALLLLLLQRRFFHSSFYSFPSRWSRQLARNERTCVVPCHGSRQPETKPNSAYRRHGIIFFAAFTSLCSRHE